MTTKKQLEGKFSEIKGRIAEIAAAQYQMSLLTDKLNAKLEVLKELFDSATDDPVENAEEVAQ